MKYEILCTVYCVHCVCVLRIILHIHHTYVTACGMVYSMMYDV